MARRVPASVARVASVAAVLIAVALISVACGGRTEDRTAQGTTETAPAELSSFDTLAALRLEDGSVTKEDALAAFAATVGPLPGVTPLPLPKQVDDEWVSGDPAIGWVVEHEAELTEAQRAAVVDALDVPGDTTGHGRARPARLDPTSAWETRAATAQTYFEERLGRRLGLRLVVRTVETAFVGRTTAFATTDGVFSGSSRDDDTGVSVDGPNVCLIQVAQGADGRSEQSKGGIIAHEVFHCFQLDAYRSQSALDATPDWVHEGLAAWAGEQPFNPSDNAANWFNTYFRGAGNGTWRLDRAGYDAIGWITSMQASGVDVWQGISSMFRRPEADPASELTANGPVAGSMTQLGGSSTRDAARGGRWMPIGFVPSSSTGARAPGRAVAGPTALVEATAGNQVTEVEPGAGAAVMRMTGSGYGVWAWGGVTHEIGQSTPAEGKWCFLDPCVCPGPEREPIPGGPYDAAPGGDPLVIGLAGMAHFASTVSFTTQTIDELCRPRTTTTAPPGDGVRATVTGFGAGTFGGTNGPTDYCTAELSGGMWLLNIGTPGDADFTIATDAIPTGPGPVNATVIWRNSTYALFRVPVTFDPGLRSGHFSGLATGTVEYRQDAASGTFDCGDGGHPIGGAAPWRGTS